MIPGQQRVVFSPTGRHGASQGTVDYLHQRPFSEGVRQWLARGSRLLVGATCAVLVGVPVGQAATTITVGTHKLLPNTPDQIVQLIATPGTPSDSATGFNLRAQLGDGMGPQPEPKFSAVDFATGTIWTGDITTLGGPVSGATQFAQASVVFDETGVQQTANGVIAVLKIDTRGLAGGIYDLKLNSAAIGFPSVLIGTGGADILPTLVDGTIDLSGALCGDFDLDADVDSADLLGFLANFTGALDPGTGTKVFLEGDCDADRDVDSADLLSLIESWTGALAERTNADSAGVLAAGLSSAGLSSGGLGSAGTGAGAMSVPEPVGSGLVVLGFLMALAGRRAQRSA